MSLSLQNVSTQMTSEELGEVVILNCDNEYFSSPFDDVKNVPAELVSQLKKQLSNQNEHMGDRVSKIFLGVLVQLIGGYRDAIKFSQGSKLSWCREDFIESRPSHLRPFLRKMLELQIFQQFIEERLEMLNTGLGFSDEFELETLRHHEKRKRKPFFRNVKEKVSTGMFVDFKITIILGACGLKTIDSYIVFVMVELLIHLKCLISFPSAFSSLVSKLILSQSSLYFIIFSNYRLIQPSNLLCSR